MTIAAFIRRMRPWVVGVVCVFLFLVVADSILRHTSLRGYAPAFQLPDGYLANPEGTGYDIVPSYPSSTFSMPGNAFPIWSNTDGCFDDEFTALPPAVYLAGDSFTWGYVPFEKTWGYLLEGSLGVSVAQCGVSGYGTAQELAKASRVVARTGSPALFIVQYFPNDRADDAWFLNDSRARTTYRYACEDASPFSAQSLRCWLNAHSVIFSSLFFLSQGTPFESFFSVRHVFNPHQPVDTAANRSAILDFKTFAATHDASLLFVLVPPAEDVEDPVLARSPANEETIAFLTEHAIPYVDLLPAFRDEAGMGTQLYWTFDRHLNPEGHRQVAVLVTRYLADHPALLVGTSGRH